MFKLAALVSATNGRRSLALPSARQATRIEGASPGCYAEALTDAEYHGVADGVSSTMLKKVMRSPAHYKAWAERRASDDTAARRFGRAVHAYVLERDSFDERYAVWQGPDRRSASYRLFERAQLGKAILTKDELKRIEGCARSVLHSDAFPLSSSLGGVSDGNGGWLVEPARTEFSIFWTDEATGLKCKVRLDALAVDPVIALDLKTCGDARPEAFTRDIISLHYDLQAAFYMEAVRRFTGKDGAWVFAAVEVDPPHEAVFYGLSPDHELMLNGARKVRHAMNIFARCQREAHWSGYGHQGLVDPAMAPWMAFHSDETEACETA